MTDKLPRPPVVARAEPVLSRDTAWSDDAGAGALDLRDMFDTVRRQVWLVVLVGAASLGGTYYLLSKEQTQYRAKALIRLRDAEAEVAGNVLQGDQTRDARTSKADPVRSEMLVLEGRQVADAVVDHEGLRLFDAELGAPSPLVAGAAVTAREESERSLSLRFAANGVTVVDGGRRASAAYGQPVGFDDVRFVVPARPDVAELSLRVVSRERAADWLSTALDARANEGTDAITVSVTSPSPLLSVRLANATVEEYQAANAARSRELSRRRRSFLEDRLGETDESLVTAQTALGRFRNRAGLYGAGDHAQAEQAGVSGAETQRKQLAAEQRIRRSLVAELARAANPMETPALQRLLASPDISSNPLVSQLLVRSTQLENRRDDLLAEGRPPEYAEVQQLQHQLSSAETRLVEAIRSQVAALDSRVTALGDARQQAAAELSRLSPAEAEEVRLGEQVDAMRQMGNELRSELQRVRLAQAVEMGQVEIVESASRAVPLWSGRSMKLALGLVFGLFIGTAIALLRGRLNAGIHRRSEVERALHVPGLAVIPRLDLPGQRRRLFGGRATITAARGRSNGADHATPDSRPVPPTVLPELVTVGSVENAAANAYRLLRTQLLFSHGGTAPRSVVVTSPSVGEGKSTTAANLAVTLAQQELRVLLVDCDLRRPHLHELFGVSNDSGLVDVLTAQPLSTAPEAFVRQTGIEHLSLLTSGPSPSGGAGPSELLGGARMELLLARARAQFDVLILDTPPVLRAPDASIIASRADATLIVVHAGRTSRALVQDALQQLDAVRANVIGVVLNDPDARTSGYRERGERYAFHARA